MDGGVVMIEPEIRTERTFGVTSTLKPIQRRNLMHFRQSEVWPDVLDVIEMVCIETESVLLNTDAANEAEVLANHKMAKAAWQMFVHLQEKIDEEIKTYLQSIAQKPPVPPLTYEEQVIENILDPTRPLPSEEMMGAQE
jgi:hypothetical protein